ncbi:MAG: hypothetical protein C0404_13755 [Verrucomicrobia bacterium]|nr:hypothetical protein [Verrucomicrobiota bacterium]
MIVLPESGQGAVFLSQMVGQVCDAFDTLPEPQRLVLWFRVSMGFNDVDCAEATSIPAGGIRVLAEQGMRGIADSLLRHGIHTDEHSVAAVLSALACRRAPAPLRNRIAALTGTTSEVQYGDLTGDTVLVKHDSPGRKRSASGVQAGRRFERLKADEQVVQKFRWRGKDRNSLNPDP